MKIRPLHDRVIVKRLEEDRTSPGGIVIPDTAAEKPIRGKIVAVGKGKILENGEVRPCDVKVGDKILFGKFSGTEVKVDGEELSAMTSSSRMTTSSSPSTFTSVPLYLPKRILSPTLTSQGRTSPFSRILPLPTAT